ncbi:hypothetical protein WMO40_16220 [Bacillaceae bacterium CLA-AA-H227]|uniref:Uncharacterized protein n=1 Tax=Robertmurraya yapensis (ex Hitch et al 2024) TaxID=3133160 RepID=A0ACC6SEJ4_9BACI
MFSVFIFTILIVSFLISIYLYIFTKNRQQAIQAMTLKSFMTGQYLGPKTTLIDYINDFFNNDGHTDGFDGSDFDDGGE